MAKFVVTTLESMSCLRRRKLSVPQGRSIARLKPACHITAIPLCVCPSVFSDCKVQVCFKSFSILDGWKLMFVIWTPKSFLLVFLLIATYVYSLLLKALVSFLQQNGLWRENINPDVFR